MHIHSGTTVEVLNTDAEGRLPMAHAMSDVIDTYDPETVVDLAPLTGGCIRALRWAATGLMASETDAAAGRSCAFQRAEDERSNVGMRFRGITPAKSPWRATSPTSRTWRGRTWRGEGPGPSTGTFLEHFTGDALWLHLDSAGAVFRTTAVPFRPHGNTGFSGRLPVDYQKTTTVPLEQA